MDGMLDDFVMRSVLHRFPKGFFEAAACRLPDPMTIDLPRSESLAAVLV